MTGSSGIAIVGASERSFWTYWIVRNLRRFGYQGQIWGVNPRPSQLDFPLVASLADVQSRLDAVVVAVRASACAAVVEEAAQLGVPDIAVVANGFAEAGDDQGRALEAGLRDLGRKHGVRIYGPNGIGFADFAKSMCLLGGPIPRGLQPGDVDVISQSGSLLLMVMQALTEERVGVDWCISLGNGASIDFARAVEICLDRPGGGPICGYLESIGTSAEDGERLAAVLDRAAAMSRPVALVKLGTSPTGVAVAQAHTASIAGDQQAVSAFLQRHGVMLASDLDDLGRLVNISRRLAGPKRGRDVGVAVIEGSGRHGGRGRPAARRVQRARPRGPGGGRGSGVVHGQPDRPDRVPQGPGHRRGGLREGLLRPQRRRRPGPVQHPVPGGRRGRAGHPPVRPDHARPAGRADRHAGSGLVRGGAGLDGVDLAVPRSLSGRRGAHPGYRGDDPGAGPPVPGAARCGCC
jgi:succinyl-CoA synthetase alpha subunit